MMFIKTGSEVSISKNQEEWFFKYAVPRGDFEY